MNFTIMQWKDILTQRRKAMLILASILLIVLLIFAVNKRHLSDLRDSITSVYEDRLVAEDYIFRLSKHIHEKRNRAHSDENLNKTAHTTNHSIDSLIKRYESTQLTPEERLYLDTLKSHLSKLQLHERQIAGSNSLEKNDSLKAQMEDQYNIILADLDILSQIQLTEGKKIMDRTDKIIASGNMTLYLEMSLLIIVSIVIRMIFSFSEPSDNRRRTPLNFQTHLN